MKHEEKVERIRPVFTDSSHYEVWIVHFEDMPTTTYGIINKETQVIENIQPNLSNATTMAKQFSVWLDGSNPNEEALRLLSTTVQ